MNFCIKYIFVTLFTVSAYAQIDDTFRAENAVVWYNFKETSGPILDKGNPRFGAPANLVILGTLPVSRIPGVLEITAANEIQSEFPVNKIGDQCRQNNEFSLEIEFQNNESSEKRSAIDQNRKIQPQRIVSFSKGLQNRNFYFGLVYNAGDIYESAINHTDVEPPTETPSSTERRRLGGSGIDPLVSKNGVASVPTRDQLIPKRQKAIVTFSKGVARMYLADDDGNLYLHSEDTVNFNGLLSHWRDGAYLTLGNEYIPRTEVASVLSQNAPDQFCVNKDAACAKNPNRFWKGRIYNVAVYCQALSRDQIFGRNTLQLAENKTFEEIPIDLNLDPTPELRRAQEIYRRLTGANTPIYDPILKEMENYLKAGNPVAAAAIATNQPGFYNRVLVDFASKMSNRDETINVPLNDFSASIVGAVRDNMSAKLWLSENFIYVADNRKAAVANNMIADHLRSNNHYESLSTGRYDLAQVLVRDRQKILSVNTQGGLTVVENQNAAGLLTTRQWMASHAIAGTNRRVVEFTFREFLCTPIEKVADSSGPEDVVGRDVDRYPGGSNSKFTTTCRACHTIMDGFRPAFAFYTFSNNFVKHSSLVPQLTYQPDDDENNELGMFVQPANIAKKYNHNDEACGDACPDKTGLVQSDSWVNNANLGSNKNTFGWKTLSGNGPAEFGKTITESKKFPICMAQRVFRSVCKREPDSVDDKMLTTVASEFANDQNYNIKYLFQKIVGTNECLGGN